VFVKTSSFPVIQSCQSEYVSQGGQYGTSGPGPLVTGSGYGLHNFWNFDHCSKVKELKLDLLSMLLSSLKGSFVLQKLENTF
jgi:hypothetical protein